jgi:peptidoglycan L-alanyl-D-glutamate endopeptidase CwlK
MRGLDKLHPLVRIKAEKLQEKCNELDLPVLITETWRTKEEQDALYAKGRTKPGNIVTNATYPNSPHCWGIAFDFCKNIKGQEFSDVEFFKKVGAVGKSLGLFWGGDFKSFKDYPHFEDRSINKTGTPEEFKKSW